jgi:hypothetical protein
MAGVNKPRNQPPGQPCGTAVVPFDYSTFLRASHVPVARAPSAVVSYVYLVGW